MNENASPETPLFPEVFSINPKHHVHKSASYSARIASIKRPYCHDCASKHSWKMELKFDLGTPKLWESMHSFHIMCTSHELFKNAPHAGKCDEVMT